MVRAAQRLNYLADLWSRHRQRVLDTGIVHLDPEVDEIAAETRTR